MKDRTENLYKFVSLKGLSVINIDDMLALRCLAGRLTKSQNVDIRLFGWDLQDIANRHIAERIAYKDSHKDWVAIHKAQIRHTAKK